MSKHNEKDFIIPILLLLYETRQEFNTEEIKKEIHKYITLTKEDLAPLPSRNSNEPGYYQIVGNLISHKNQNLLRYVSISDEGKRKNKTWKINEEGIKHISNFLESSENNLFLHDSVNDIQTHQTNQPFISIATEDSNIDYSSITVEDCNEHDKRIIDYSLKHPLNSRPATDSKIAKVILEINNYTCQYAKYTGEKHASFLAKNGKPYVEAHHLIPMKAARDFFPKNLDIPANIVCLCAECHAKLHHGDLAVRKQMLKTLYDKYIEGLNDEDLFISFEELFEKYYK